MRGIELDRVSRRQLAHVEGGMAGGEAELDEVGFLVVEADVRALGCPHEGARSDLDLDIAALPGVEEVARGQRHVDLGGRPLLGAGAPEGHLAVEIAQACRRHVAGRRRHGHSWRS